MSVLPENTAESVVPIAYNFPTVGNVFTLLFILFMSFFYAIPMAIADHLRLKRLTEYPLAAWMAIEHDPVVASEHLDQHRQLTSVLSVTYRVKR